MVHLDHHISPLPITDMRAARFYNKYDIRIENIDPPEPKDGEVLINVAWGGICGTDLHEYTIGPLVIPTKEHPSIATGDHLPVTIGHEFCGHVAKASEGAVGADGTPLKVGTPVMCDPRLNCRSCFSCTAGDSNVCGKWGFLGLSGAGGGGFSETVAVRADMCYPLPEDLPMDQAVLIEPLAVGRRAVRQSGIPDDKLKDTTILVVGGGPVGFSVLCNLRAAGAKQVFISEPAAQRQEQSRPLCQQTFDPIKQKVAEECRKLTDGKGVDLVFDCAGIPPGMKDGFDALRARGTYVNVAGWEQPFVLPMHTFMAKELQVRTTLAYDDKDFGDVVRDFVAGKVFGICLSTWESPSLTNGLRQIQRRREYDHCSGIAGRSRREGI